DRESEGAVAGGISAIAKGTNPFHLSSSCGEQSADRCAVKIRRDRYRLRNDSSEQSFAVARTDERSRRTHVGRNGRVLFGQAQWRQRRFVRRRAWCATGPRGRGGRRHIGRECLAHG